MNAPIPKFAGKIIHGSIELADPKQFKMYCCGFKNESEIEVIVRKPSKSRSLNQNDYYWGVVIDILCDHTGDAPKRTHAKLGLMFLLRRDKKDGSEYVESTTELSTVEFEEYLEKIRQWASDPDEGINCYIPLPNEVTTTKVFVQE